MGAYGDAWGYYYGRSSGSRFAQMRAGRRAFRRLMRGTGISTRTRRGNVANMFGRDAFSGRPRRRGGIFFGSGF